MRILIVTQYFWPESFIVNSLAVELHKRGHQVSVLTGLPNYPSGSYFDGFSLMGGPWTEDYHGVRIMRVPLLARGRGFFRLALNYLSFVISGITFSLFRRMNHPDVIFCFAPSPVTGCLPAVFLKTLKKSPLVFWVQDLWPESVSAVGATQSNRALQMIGKLVRFIYKRCDYILVQSESFKDSVIKWGGRPETLKYIPNWADPFQATSSVPPWIQKLPVGFRIAFAGNIGKAQDMPTLIKAAEILKSYPEIKWIIAGDGSEKAWLDQEVIRLGLQNSVLTVGRKSYDEMLPFFHACDVLLVSLRDEYIFSLTVPAKVQAYLSSGKPIIASLAGEGARIVNVAAAGLTCEPQNPQALAEAVLKMFQTTKEEQNRMGQNGLQYFKNNFERSRIINNIEATLKEAIQNHQARRSQ